MDLGLNNGPSRRRYGGNYTILSEVEDCGLMEDQLKPCGAAQITTASEPVRPARL